MKYLALIFLVVLSLTACAPDKDYSKDITALQVQVQALANANAKVAPATQLSGNITTLSTRLDAITKQLGLMATKADIAAVPAGLTVKDGSDIRARLSAIEGQDLMLNSRQTAWETRMNAQILQYDTMINQRYGNLGTQFATKSDIMILQAQLQAYANMEARLTAVEVKLGLR